MTTTPFSPDEIYSLTDKSIQIVDTRDVEPFAEKHIPDSFHLPLVPNFIAYSKSVLNPTKPIILILTEDKNFSYVERMLNIAGFITVLGYLQGGMSNWNYPTETLPTVSVNELELLLKGPDATLIDVRTEAEFKEDRIAKSVHYPLGKFDEKKVKAIPEQNKVYLICGGGTRSSIMASNLKRNGVLCVHNVRGGMSAWRTRQN